MHTVYDRSLSRLLARAGQEQSSPALPESLSTLPWPLRFAVADLFAQIQAGEEAALAAVQRISAEEPDASARAFARLQLAEERRHVAFFAGAQVALRVRRAPMDGLRRMFALAVCAPSLPELMLANHLVVETLAHELFRSVAAVFTRCARSSLAPRSWRRAFASLAEGMRVVLQDESRHVAFGVLRLRELRTELTGEGRSRFDDAAAAWGRRLEETLAGLPVFFLLRPWFRARARTVVRQYRQRCLDVGVGS